MKVFITTSGVGSRLGNLTKYTNKSMVKIGKKPALSYIIEQYPKEYTFVIALGYFGSHTRQFLELAYPDRKFEFVEVENYNGKGSSQVLSQLYAKSLLQEPFIYNDCDTIVDNLMSYIPDSWENNKYNWLAGYPTSKGDKTNLSLYDSFDVNKAYQHDDGTYNIIKMYKKGECENPDMLYIGLAGIYDYEEFWDTLERAYREQDAKNLSDFFVYYKYNMFAGHNKKLKAISVDNWQDTGSIAGIMEFRKNVKDRLDILDKNDQAIFMIGDKVIKFFAKDGVVDNLIKRYDVLGKLSHPIRQHTKNFFVYDFIEGTNAIVDMNKSRFENMLVHFDANGLWDEKPSYDEDKFNNDRDNFYITKTIDRVNDFLTSYGMNEERDLIVNGESLPREFSVLSMLRMMMNMPEYKKMKPTRWHGDFVLDNMLYTPAGQYVLIDPREKFGSDVEWGECLYDFAKMNHNLTFNFSSATKNLFSVKEKDINDNMTVVDCSILCNVEVYRCKEALKSFVESRGIRWEFIEMLTGLIWMNMAPLHWDPLKKWLYYYGKLTMYKALSKLVNSKPLNL